MWTSSHYQRKVVLFAAVCVLQLMSLASATSRSFAPHDYVDKQGQIPKFLPHKLNSKQDTRSMGGGMVGEEVYNVQSAIGSRPPSCVHKCGGCVPCEAIQVPTSNDRVKVQYANYEPEGWKCKCGTTFFSP